MSLLTGWEKDNILKQNERNVLKELRHAVDDGNIESIRNLSSQYETLSVNAKTKFKKLLIFDLEYDPRRERWVRIDKLRFKAEAGNLEFVKFIIELGKQLDCHFISENLFPIRIVLNGACGSRQYHVAEFLIINCPGAANNQALYITESNRFGLRWDPENAENSSKIIDLLISHGAGFDVRTSYPDPYFDFYGGGGLDFRKEAEKLDREYQKWCKDFFSEFELVKQDNGKILVKKLEKN